MMDQVVKTLRECIRRGSKLPHYLQPRGDRDVGNNRDELYWEIREAVVELARAKGIRIIEVLKEDALGYWDEVDYALTNDVWKEIAPRKTQEVEAITAFCNFCAHLNDYRRYRRKLIY